MIPAGQEDSELMWKVNIEDLQDLNADIAVARGVAARPSFFQWNTNSGLASWIRRDGNEVCKSRRGDRGVQMKIEGWRSTTNDRNIILRGTWAVPAGEVMRAGRERQRTSTPSVIPRRWIDICAFL